MTDLNVQSFGEGPNAVPTSTYARVVADIAPEVRGDQDDRVEAANNDTELTRKRGF